MTLDLCKEYESRQLTLINVGLSNGSTLAEALGDRGRTLRHIFLGDGRLYRRHFRSDDRILQMDGFERRRNRDHPPVEFFSNLHVIFEEEGMNGFGDFLTVGDEYSGGGGPAYAIAIHLTFIDPNQDEAMFVRHFFSKRQDTSVDPVGKFTEDLNSMIADIDTRESLILESNAVQEFRQLHADGHYPGLGYVRKLSMQHHIETPAIYFGE